MRGNAVTWVLFCLATLASAARGEVTIPDPGTYVVDRAKVIDRRRRDELERWLSELEKKTTAQVKVLTVTSIEGDDFFRFVQRHYDLWRLGRKRKDNGALIAFALHERHVRIHTGYGLEGVLPDSWCGSLAREIARDYFKQGRYGEGLYRMAVAVANKVADDAGVKLSGVPPVRHVAPRDEVPGWVVWVVVALVLIAIFVSWYWAPAGRRGWQGGWGPVYGGGFGGGYGGGFGGGWGGSRDGFGGGSFGGGGRSGGGGGGASW
jgi:uncharacterized protein